jgi:hypothetical protein
MAVSNRRRISGMCKPGLLQIRTALQSQTGAEDLTFRVQTSVPYGLDNMKIQGWADIVHIYNRDNLLAGPSRSPFTKNSANAL